MIFGCVRISGVGISFDTDDDIFFGFFQDSSSFSFRRCLPSGWTFLLFSGIVTLVSEKIFLDPDDFWRTFSIHFLVGITSFMLAAFIM